MLAISFGSFWVNISTYNCEISDLPFFSICKIITSYVVTLTLIPEIFMQIQQLTLGNSLISIDVWQRNIPDTETNGCAIHTADMVRQWMHIHLQWGPLTNCSSHWKTVISFIKKWCRDERPVSAFIDNLYALMKARQWRWNEHNNICKNDAWEMTDFSISADITWVLLICSMKSAFERKHCFHPPWIILVMTLFSKHERVSDSSLAAQI